LRGGDAVLMIGGTEMVALWLAVFLSALAESALHFASWAKLEDMLEGPQQRRRYAHYLEGVRVYAALCVVVRLAATGAFVAFAVLRAGVGPGRPLIAVAAAVALLVLAEIAARLIGRRWSAGVLLGALPLLHVLAYPFRPVAWSGPHEVEPEEQPHPEVVEAAKEEIRVALADGATEGAIEAEERQMIEGILRFGDVDVGQIMTPRTDIEYLQADVPLAEAARSLAAFHHSRIPVCEDTLDEVVGILYVKDLLALVERRDSASLPLRQATRKPLFVPETNTVDLLLEKFRDEHIQIAVVVDEYGGTSGVVTVEDILEEIVGEIEDEYDQEESENRVRLRSSGGVEVDARVRIDEVNEMFDLDIPEDEDYDSVGGYVTDRFGRVPDPGEEYRENGVLVRILQSDERRVRRVFLKRVEPEKEEG
jgi:magnesium and cobalt exporter, CNNM family